jgi:hypothetical protein
LVAFEAGALELPQSMECSDHLLDCRECLAKFFSVKRVREDAAAFDERPPAHVHERLRKRVALRARRRPIVWGLAAAALVVAVLAAKAAFAPAPHLQPLTPLIDSAPLVTDEL